MEICKQSLIVGYRGLPLAIGGLLYFFSPISGVIVLITLNILTGYKFRIAHPEGERGPPTLVAILASLANILPFVLPFILPSISQSIPSFLTLFLTSICTDPLGSSLWLLFAPIAIHSIVNIIQTIRGKSLAIIGEEIKEPDEPEEKGPETDWFLASIDLRFHLVGKLKRSEAELKTLKQLIGGAIERVRDVNSRLQQAASRLSLESPFGNTQKFFEAFKIYFEEIKWIREQLGLITSNKGVLNIFDDKEKGIVSQLSNVNRALAQHCLKRAEAMVATLVGDTKGVRGDAPIDGLKESYNNYCKRYDELMQVKAILIGLPIRTNEENIFNDKYGIQIEKLKEFWEGIKGAIVRRTEQKTKPVRRVEARPKETAAEPTAVPSKQAPVPEQTQETAQPPAAETRESKLTLADTQIIPVSEKPTEKESPKAEEVTKPKEESIELMSNEQEAEWDLNRMLGELENQKQALIKIAKTEPEIDKAKGALTAYVSEWNREKPRIENALNEIKSTEKYTRFSDRRDRVDGDKVKKEVEKILEGKEREANGKKKKPGPFDNALTILLSLAVWQYIALLLGLGVAGLAYAFSGDAKTSISLAFIPLIWGMWPEYEEFSAAKEVKAAVEFEIVRSEELLAKTFFGEGSYREAADAAFVIEDLDKYERNYEMQRLFGEIFFKVANRRLPSRAHQLQIPGGVLAIELAAKHFYLARRCIHPTHKDWQYINHRLGSSYYAWSILEQDTKQKVKLLKKAIVSLDSADKENIKVKKLLLEAKRAYVEELTNLGDDFIIDGKPNKAIINFERALVVSKNSPELKDMLSSNYISLAEGHLEQKEYLKAKEILELAYRDVDRDSIHYVHILTDLINAHYFLWEEEDVRRLADEVKLFQKKCQEKNLDIDNLLLDSYLTETEYYLVLIENKNKEQMGEHTIEKQAQAFRAKAGGRWVWWSFLATWPSLLGALWLGMPKLMIALGLVFVWAIIKYGIFMDWYISVKISHKLVEANVVNTYKEANKLAREIDIGLSTIDYKEFRKLVKQYKALRKEVERLRKDSVPEQTLQAFERILQTTREELKIYLTERDIIPQAADVFLDLALSKNPVKWLVARWIMTHEEVESQFKSHIMGMLRIFPVIGWIIRPIGYVWQRLSAILISTTALKLPESYPPYLYKATEQIYVVQDDLLFSNVISRFSEKQIVFDGDSTPTVISKRYRERVRYLISHCEINEELKEVLISLYTTPGLAIITKSTLIKVIDFAAESVSHEKRHIALDTFTFIEKSKLSVIYEEIKETISRLSIEGQPSKESRTILEGLKMILKRLEETYDAPEEQQAEMVINITEFERGELQIIFKTLGINWSTWGLDEKEILDLLERLHTAGKVAKEETETLSRIQQEILGTLTPPGDAERKQTKPQKKQPIIAIQEGKILHITKENIESIEKSISIIWPTFKEITYADMEKHNMDLFINSTGGYCISNLGRFHLVKTAVKEGKPCYLMVPGSTPKKYPSLLDIYKMSDFEISTVNNIQNPREVLYIVCFQNDNRGINQSYKLFSSEGNELGNFSVDFNPNFLEGVSFNILPAEMGKGYGETCIAWLAQQATKRYASSKYSLRLNLVNNLAIIGIAQKIFKDGTIEIYDSSKGEWPNLRDEKFDFFKHYSPFAILSNDFKKCYGELELERKGSTSFYVVSAPEGINISKDGLLIRVTDSSTGKPKPLMVKSARSFALRGIVDRDYLKKLKIVEGPSAEPDKARTSDVEVDTQQTHNFEPVDVAMGRIKEIVEKSRNENPDMPILILLDGRCEDGKHIGKTTLADAIDTTHSLKNYYENKYKNFGLDDLNQDVIVTHGDILRPLFKKKVDNPDEVEAIKMFHPGMPYEVVAEDTEWIKGKLKEHNSLTYTRYLRHYIEIAFSKMKELYGTKDRIIVFDEADSHIYFEDTLNSNAPEDILIIKARLRLKPDEGDKREMSIHTSIWSSAHTSPGDIKPSDKPGKADTTSVDYEQKAKEALISELKKILSDVLPERAVDRIPKEVLIKLVFITLQDISKTQRKNAVTSLLGNYGVGKKQAPKILGALRKAIPGGRITPFLVAAGMPEGYEKIWPSQKEDFWIGEKERDPIKLGIKDALLNIFKKYNIYPNQEETIVDLGARRGWLEKLLGEDWAYAITLFDKNEYYLRQARKRGLGKAYVSGNIYELPDRIKDIKVIISVETFDTFLDLEKAVSQCYAALAPGGIMVIAQFSPPQIEPLVKELQEKGKVYSPDCVEFFDSIEKRRRVEEAYREYASLSEDSSEEQQKITFYKFLELREKLSFDKYTYFHRKLVRALQKCKFEIIQEGEMKGYYKGIREERHNVVGEDTNVIYSRGSYGMSKYNPSLAPGMVEEEVYMNVVVARKPKSAVTNHPALQSELKQRETKGQRASLWNWLGFTIFGTTISSILTYIYFTSYLSSKAFLIGGVILPLIVLFAIPIFMTLSILKTGANQIAVTKDGETEYLFFLVQARRSIS
ncbi:hypothetical protein ES705_16865 [subsurface metagenome]